MTDEDKAHVVAFEVENIMFVDIPTNLVRESDQIVIVNESDESNND